MARGKVDESNKAKSTKNTRQDTKKRRQTAKKSDAAAKKEAKVAAGDAKKVSNAAAAKNKRIAKWEEEENLILLEGWARDGLSMEQIAYNMGISKKTLYNWQLSSLPILHSLRKGKEESDSEVENTLFKKCNGFIKEVIKPMKIRKAEYDPETGKKIYDYDEIVYVKDQVYVQPDTAAIKYYLSNRLPEKWREKMDHTIEADESIYGVIEIPAILERTEDESGI